MKRSSALLAALICTTCLAGNWSAYPDAFSGSYGPLAPQKVAKPNLTWEVWSPTLELTRITLSIDDTEVPAKYNPDSRAIEYRPDSPLSPGTHHVVASVTFGSDTRFRKSWEVKILPTAITEFPSPTKTQLEILKLVNDYRLRLNLPNMELDDCLAAAAQSHTDYMVANKVTGHGEDPSNTGYIANSGAERCEIFGWCGGSWEGVTYGNLTVSQMVKGLFDAPYHRLPFMQPGKIKIGAAYASEHLSVEFGGSPIAASEVSPADGETDVPVKWECHEHPNPIKVHTSKNTVGYPIMFASFARRDPTFKVKSAVLQSESGDEVPTWLNTPENDEHLNAALILIPQEPLKAGSTFVAHVVVEVDGQIQDKTWKFTTR